LAPNPEVYEIIEAEKRRGDDNHRQLMHIAEFGQGREREVANLRDALMQAKMDIVRLRDAPLSIEDIIARAAIERIDRALLE